MKKNKRLLILASNPEDGSRVRVDKEIREIEDGLRLSKHRERFKINTRWILRPGDIRRALLDYEPDIVHFCGYGNGEGLMVEDENGKAELLQTDALADLFELFSGKVKCVLLNTRHSGLQARTVNRYIDFVIGMNSEVRDTAAIEFSTGFYDALGAGRSYEDAFKFGKNALRLKDIPESSIPVFYARQYSTALPPTGTNRVFQCYAPEDKAEFAEPLAGSLKNYGIEMLPIDGAVGPGDSLAEKISRVIGECEYAVVLLTPRSIGSSWVNVELHRVLEQFQEEDIRIVPVVFPGCEVPRFMKRFLYVDFRKYFGYGLKELLWTFGVETRLLSEAETRKLLLKMLSPGLREQVKKHVLLKDIPKKKAIKEVNKKKIIFLLLGIIMWGYLFTWHALRILYPLGPIGVLAGFGIHFGLIFLGAHLGAKYTHPRFAIDKYFKLLSTLDEFIKDHAPVNLLTNPGKLYYELLDKNGKRFYKKYRMDQNDIDYSLDRCKRRYLVYGSFPSILFAALVLYDATVPQYMEGVIYFQALFAAFGWLIYTFYDSEVKAIWERYNIKRDFERLGSVLNYRNH